MIKKLENNLKDTAGSIWCVWQISYAVEAEILNAKEFPPLNRTVQNFMDSETDFFGFYKNETLAGVIEILKEKRSIHIQSMVVKPEFFRQGIARRLISFVLNNYSTQVYTVETGAGNIPAVKLYEGLGFKEIKQYRAEFNILKMRFELRKI